jgi:hypothetical protein
MQSIQSIFLSNLPLKIGAVFFATLLWFHTITEKNYQYNLEVTRSIIELPEGMRLVDEKIPNVEVTLYGKGKSLLECFEKGAVYLNIDLSGYSAGSFEYPVDASNVVLPKAENLSVVDIVFPKFIHLELVKTS